MAGRRLAAYAAEAGVDPARKTETLAEVVLAVDTLDRLRIGFGPDRLYMDLNINGPGDPMVIDPVTLETDFGPGDLPPYGEVLRAVLADDPTLSVRGATAEQCWRIVEPVLAAWRNDEVPLLEYPAGTTLHGSLLDGRPGHESRGSGPSR